MASSSHFHTGTWVGSLFSTSSHSSKVLSWQFSLPAHTFSPAAFSTHLESHCSLVTSLQTGTLCFSLRVLKPSWTHFLVVKLSESTLSSLKFPVKTSEEHLE